MRLLIAMMWLQTVLNGPLESPAPARSAGVWVERLFGLSELTESGVHVSGSWKGLGLDARLSTFGFDLYRETGFRGGTGLSYGDLRAGLALETRLLSPKGFPVRRAVGIDAWMQMPVGRSTEAGLLIRNLNADPNLPQIWSAGMAVRATGTIGMSGWIWLDAGHPPDARFRLSWSVMPPVVFDLTRHIDPVVWVGRLGVRAGPVSTRITLREHPVLGWSQAMEVAWQW